MGSSSVPPRDEPAHPDEARPPAAAEFDRFNREPDHHGELPPLSTLPASEAHRDDASAFAGPDGDESNYEQVEGDQIDAADADGEASESPLGGTGQTASNPFVEPESEHDMSRVTEGPRSDRAAAGASTKQRTGERDQRGAGAESREALVGKTVCPFCGQIKSSSAEPCPRCTMEDSPATRQATKARIGPWYVLQNRSPSAPGMKYATLLWLVNKGHVTPRSIVRGPTTHQLWRYAAHVRGLSREFGLCYSCGGAVEKSASLCPHCERPQDPPANPDSLLELRETGASAGSSASSIGLAASPRAPVMREVDTRQARAAAEARRTPPPPATPSGPARGLGREHDSGEAFDSQESERAGLATSGVTAAATASGDALSVDSPSHAERLRARNEMILRQRQDLARRSGAGGGALVSATDLAAALQDPDDAPPRGRRVSILNIILFVLLLAGGAAAAVLYVKPEYRAPTAQWLNETWASVKSKLSSMQWNSPPGEPPVAPAPVDRPAPTLPAPAVVHKENNEQSKPDPMMSTGPRAEPKLDPKAQAKVEPKADPADPPPPAREATLPKMSRQQEQQHRQQAQRDAIELAREDAAAAPRQQPETRADAGSPDARPTETIATRPPPAPPVQPKQEPEPQHQQQQRQQQEAKPDPAPERATEQPRSIEQAIEESRRLRGLAIDAEAQNDYAAALRYYEQMKKLPREAWPGDLDIRIELARDQLKAQSNKSRQ